MAENEKKIEEEVVDIKMEPVPFTPDVEGEIIAADDLARRIGSVIKQATADYEGASIQIESSSGNVYAILWFADSPASETKAKFVKKIRDTIPSNGNIIDITNGAFGSTAKSLTLTPTAKKFLEQIIPNRAPDTTYSVVSKKNVLVHDEAKNKDFYVRKNIVNWNLITSEKISYSQYERISKVYLRVVVDVTKFMKLANGSKTEDGDVVQYKVYPRPTNTLAGQLLELSMYHVEPIEEKTRRYSENKLDNIGFVRPE